MIWHENIFHFFLLIMTEHFAKKNRNLIFVELFSSFYWKFWLIWLKLVFTSAPLVLSFVFLHFKKKTAKLTDWVLISVMRICRVLISNVYFTATGSYFVRVPFDDCWISLEIRKQRSNSWKLIYKHRKSIYVTLIWISLLTVIAPAKSKLLFCLNLFIALMKLQSKIEIISIGVVIKTKTVALKAIKY